jgi:hypothetical protein
VVFTSGEEKVQALGGIIHHFFATGFNGTILHCQGLFKYFITIVASEKWLIN